MEWINLPTDETDPKVICLLRFCWDYNKEKEPTYPDICWVKACITKIDKCFVVLT